MRNYLGLWYKIGTIKMPEDRKASNVYCGSVYKGNYEPCNNAIGILDSKTGHFLVYRDYYTGGMGEAKVAATKMFLGKYREAK